MAFVTNMNQDEQQNQAQGVVSPGGVNNTVKINPSSGVGGVGTAPTTGNAGSPTAGGQFASLNQYVNANQGTAQGLANNVTQGIGKQYDTLQGQNQQTLSGIQNQVTSGYTPQNQDILAQEAANPVSFASNPTNIQSFQAQANDKYIGPTKAENDAGYQAQLANVNNAISTGQSLTGSDTGRQQLLAQTEATPNAGVTGLNSAILSQDSNAQSQITNAYNPFSNLVSGLQTGAGAIDTSIGQAQTQAQNASNAANAQITGQVNALNTGVSNTANQEEAQRAANNNTITQTQNLWQQPNSFLNSANTYLTSNGGTALSNPISAYVAASPFSTPATVNNVATADQYAQAGAFQNLINGLNSSIPAPILDQNQISQAGTYKAPALLPSLDNKAVADQIWQNWINNYTQMVQNGQKQGSSYQGPPQTMDASNLYNSLLQFDPNLVI